MFSNIPVGGRRFKCNYRGTFLPYPITLETWKTLYLTGLDYIWDTLCYQGVISVARDILRGLAKPEKLSWLRQTTIRTAFDARTHMSFRFRVKFEAYFPSWRCIHLRACSSGVVEPVEATSPVSAALIDLCGVTMPWLGARNGLLRMRVQPGTRQTGSPPILIPLTSANFYRWV